MEKKKTTVTELSEAAKEARRAYQRKYYAEHREAAKRRRAEYWERQAAKLQAGE